MTARLRPGDTVVLNGHRLTVELVTGEPGAPEDVFLRDGQGREVRVPADLLPEPEPRATPETEPGSLGFARWCGRLGLVTDVGPQDGSGAWFHPAGDRIAHFVYRADLRPVTLVEKPERTVVVATLKPLLQGSGSARARNAERVYDSLFPESPS